MIKSWRTIWLSDLHIGTSSCRAKLLLDFLKHNKCNNLYLVGDIIETWHLKKWYSDKYQDKLIKKLQHLARKCDQVYYIVGNHEQPFIDIAKSILSDFKFTTEDIIYTSISKKKFLITHGNRFDSIPSNFVLLRILYKGINKWNSYKIVNKLHNLVDRYLASRIDKFRTKAIVYAKSHLCDGVILGHSHISDYIQVDNTLYINLGCWITDNCTALVEDYKGNFELISWT